MSKIQFTRASVQRLSAPKSGRTYYRDADKEFRGLGILAQSSGYMSYFWSRKLKGHGLAWETIGRVEDVSLEAARASARGFNLKLGEWKRTGCTGPNPFASAAGGDLTLEELVERYIEVHIKSKAANPEKAAKIARWTLNKYLSDWRDRRLTQISQRDIQTLHHQISESEPDRNTGRTNRRYTGNRIVAFLTSLFTFAIKQGLFAGENPARRIELNAEEKRTRYLSDEEFVRLAVALDAETDPDFRDYVWLSLKTGARKSDVLGMLWKDVHLSAKLPYWDCPNSKSRKGQNRYDAHFDAQLVEILSARQTQRVGDNPHVFPAPFAASGRLMDVTRFWKALVKRAKLENFRPHDLRHTYISWQVQKGASLFIAGQLVGHASIASTARYAHLNRKPIVDSVEAALSEKDKLVADAKKAAAAKAKPPRVVAMRRRSA